MEELLKELQEYLKKINYYDHALALLQWDLQTIASKNGLEAKAEAISYFATESFKLTRSEEYGNLLLSLSAPEYFEQLSPAMKVTVKRGYQDYVRLQRVPQDFYTEYVTASTLSGNAWEEAKQANSYAAFEPHLDRMITMTRQYISYMEPDKDPYEVLLNDYEEGMDSQTIDRLFDQLKEGLLPLLADINAAGRPDLSALEGSYDIDGQKKVEKLLLSYIGFNFDSGTSAESEHPFTTKICPQDVRITNHFHETQPLSSMFSAIHEGGHAIFDQSVAPELEGTAASEINFMGLHESQSRFYENILGRRRNFWLPIYDRVRELLPALQNVSLDTFHRAINDVHPSPIRIEADEVTYCMHIILRYEIEKAIFRDNLTAKELPALWNQKMQELLGITPENDAEGILQDVHWSGGGFGYFPSYLLGSVFDGMILQQMEKELGDLDTILAEGRILTITQWLQDNIHKNGSLYTSRELIERLCGEEISAKPLLDHFRKKYADIYGFQA